MTETKNYELYETHGGGVPIKAWTRGVHIEEGARRQLENTASMPFVHKWVAAMPDVHWGLGATVGSVVPTTEAIIPAAVGVDIGCGMMAVRTSLTLEDLPDNLKAMRTTIERACPHGRSGRGGRRDKGAFGDIPNAQARVWKNQLQARYEAIVAKHRRIEKSMTVNQLGTLGTGNHFIEVCKDLEGHVWFMLHSGSRGIGNRIGSYFIQIAKKEMERHQVHLPDENLAYLQEGSDHFDDYVEAVEWAQDYARLNRELMMEQLVAAVRRLRGFPKFQTDKLAVNCHHNYVNRETHYGVDCYVTRKGAVRAREGELGIIPGSMGARSFIVRGLGNKESFESCSHGAGRIMSRTKAKKVFSLDDHIEATRDVECRKDSGVIDETPGAYKPIEDVMAAQTDLVEVVHELKQLVCVKG